MTSSGTLPEFVLFGASMIEWSFEEKTQGLGYLLRKKYAGKYNILNEGQAGYTTKTIQPDFDRVIQRATTPGIGPTLLFAILIGANDAAYLSSTPQVPQPQYEANIRRFVDTILAEPAMADTKIVLVSPPPSSFPTKRVHGLKEEDVRYWNSFKIEAPPYKTYMAKKAYAEAVMRIAGEYEETGRVGGFDLWRAIFEAGVERDGDGDEGVERDEEVLPGSGLVGAKEFAKGWFTDGLHLDVKGYRVLFDGFMELVGEKWPELAP
ncbi:SGNH hydrolase [Pyrenochaeta sp. DS3sAY3a]|nr:SGNH hydrolase [Pyrenochaeta sp. DS3sAY3a]